jgi:dihydrodipicolinate synthase/N-acetylneuraminate lyase
MAIKKSKGNNVSAMEKPDESVIMGFEGVAFLFLLGAIAAVVAWMVYVAKFNLHLYKKATDGDGDITAQINASNFTLKDVLTIDQFTICYQAVVMAALLYFAFKYHFAD